MAIVQSPVECCTVCPEPITTSIPGAPGSDGADGAAGAAGANAFTTCDSFVMPALGANVTITVVSSAWAVENMIVAVNLPGDAAFGYFLVADIPSATSLQLTNLEDAGGHYASNSAPATVFPNLSRVCPSGLQGLDGLAGAPTTASYWTRVAEGGLSAESAMAVALPAGGVVQAAPVTGVPSQAANCTALEGLVGAADRLPYFTALATMALATFTAWGRSIAAAANAAAGRVLLALGTIATQDANAVTITGGSINGTTVGAGTPSTGSFTTLRSSTSNTQIGTWIQTPSVLQTLNAIDLIQANAAKIRVVGNAAPMLMTSTPTISGGTADGQRLLIKGTSAANTITIQDAGTLGGTTLELGAATRVLGLYSQIELSWDATDSKWCEISYAAN